MRLLLLVILALIITGSVDNNRAREANRAYEAGEYQRAEMLYRELLQEQPGNPHLLFNLGNTLARQEKTEESVDVFERYRDLVSDPTDRSPAEYNLGYLHGEAGNTEEALNHFRQALDLTPEDDDAKFNYELLKRKQQSTSPDQNEEEEEEEEEEEDQEQNQQPQSGEPPPSSESDPQPDDNADQQSPPPANDDSPESEEQPAGGQPEITDEQLDHAEDIMNALEQIEKDLIKDFKKRQQDPVEPHVKDW